MIDDHLRCELEAMRREDLKVRGELVAAGELGGSYVPRMEAVHRRNAARLRELIALHGWPAEDIAGKDGAEAAWLIVQHAIGEPEFQREALQLLRACAASGRAPAWHAAYLEDRIAMYEGRPQRYGTQCERTSCGRWARADAANSRSGLRVARGKTAANRRKPSLVAAVVSRRGMAQKVAQPMRPHER